MKHIIIIFISRYVSAFVASSISHDGLELSSVIFLFFSFYSVCFDHRRPNDQRKPRIVPVTAFTDSTSSRLTMFPIADYIVEVIRVTFISVIRYDTTYGRAMRYPNENLVNREKNLAQSMLENIHTHVHMSRKSTNRWPDEACETSRPENSRDCILGELD